MSISKLEAERDGILANGSVKKEWMEKLRQYKDKNNLDRELTAFLIDKVEVFGGNKIQVSLRFDELLEEMEQRLAMMKEAV